MTSRRFRPLKDAERYADPNAYKLAKALAEWNWNPISSKVWERTFFAFKTRVFLEDKEYVVSVKKHGEFEWREEKRGLYNRLPLDDNGNVRYIYMGFE